MKKKTIAAISIITVIASLLSGCGANINVTPETEPVVEETDIEQEVDYSTGTPWICSMLDGVVTEDTPAELKDDFYLGVNKDNILKATIPDGYTVTGGVYNLNREFEKDLKAMFTDGKKSSTHEGVLAQKMYSLFVDWDTRNELGVEPLKEKVDAVEDISSIEEMTDYFMNTSAGNLLSTFFYADCYEDLYDSSKNNLLVYDYTPILGDSAEYVELTEYGKIKKEANSKLAKNMLIKLGYEENEADAKIENALAFDSVMAEVMYTNEEEQMPDIIQKIYNMYSYDEIKELEGQVPVLEILESEGYADITEAQIYNPKWMEKMQEIYTDDNLTMLKDNLIVRGVIGAAEDLDRECYSMYLECENMISGSNGERPYELVAAKRVNSNLKWAVARLYAERYLKEKDKERITDFVDKVIEEYYCIIGEADFLSDDTKKMAMDKLDSMNTFVLYPDDWTPYSYNELDFAGADEGGSINDAFVQIAEYDIKKTNEKISKPVDKDEWAAAPSTINCCYSPSGNAILILGAFARGDVYNAEMSDEELYGRLGAVIGHEISHAFDSMGSQYDKNGNVNNWWKQEDLDKFNEKNQRIADYLNSLTLWEGEKVNGDIMVGEACADMGGLKCMINLGKKIPGFDFDKFFRAYAELWFSKHTLQEVYMNNNDVHPLIHHRINVTLQQFPEFIELYGIKEGDGMYLAPEDRINIW